MSLDGRRACVIGAGLGGLALAIRLQAAGLATTILEARDKPGGQASGWEHDGFIFDAGPTTIADPPALRELWALTGHDMDADVELLPLAALWRLNWPDGTSLDWLRDAQQLPRDIARLRRADAGGAEAFLGHAEETYREGYLPLAARPFLELGSLASVAGSLARQRPWRSLHATAARFVRDDKLRQALSFRTLAIGGNPLAVSGLYAFLGHIEQAGGVWAARGGTQHLVAAMARHFERLGGELRLGDPAGRIDTAGRRCRGVETRAGHRQACDALASNAELVHTYRDLLGGVARGSQTAARLARKAYAPSAFVVHFALEGSWPGIPHRTMLFGPRYQGWLEDIFDRGVLPADFAIELHHPSVTDPSLAPQGASVFQAIVPVPHLGKLAVDWQQLGPMFERRILDEIGRRLIPDIHDRLVASRHRTPRDFAAELKAHLGSPHGLAPIPSQSLWLRAHNRDGALENFYLVGSGTHPGPGLSAVLAGAKVTASLMLQDLAA
ncbi:MAG: phytoene desaturase [Alphaproteobacteria bacterium]|nr:phytoene desaturase [Alphaproteobacteria bacterium]